jgi:hypothetical protein
MKKSQTFSFDIMIAVIIFLSAFFVFYIILGGSQKEKVGELQDDASKILEAIVSKDSKVRVVDEDIINATRLIELLDDYPAIKQQLRVQNDFCIYFEDNAGKTIFIEISETEKRSGIGSQTIKVSGTPCS